MPLDGDNIAVWFSCGAASAVAAKLTIEKYGSICNVRILNNPVIEEHSDNTRFLKDVETWLGIKIESVTNPKFPTGSAKAVWTKRKYMSGVRGAPCTYELKIRARQLWEKNNIVQWHVLGFTTEEKKRHDRFILTERSNVLPILIENNISKQTCFDILLNAGIELPLMYRQGFPNANCIGCVKVRDENYWQNVRKFYPEIFNERAKQSREIGCKLIKDHNGQRIYLDMLPNLPAKPMIKNHIECGLFCEEKF